MTVGTTPAPAGSNLRIVHMIPHCDVGGADQVIVDLFAGSPPGVSQYAVITEVFPSRWLSRLLPSAAGAWRLSELAPPAHHPAMALELVREIRPHVVHIMNSRLGFDLAPAFRRLEQPPAVVAHMHGEGTGGFGYPALVARRHLDAVDMFVTSSRALGDRLSEHGVPEAKRRVIHAGIDEARFTPDPARAPAGAAGPWRIFFPGRLAIEKDPALFVATIAELRRRGLDVRGRMLGGLVEREVRDLVRAEGLEEAVSIAGPVPDTLPEYRAADLALLTSVSEGIPLGVLEALACRVPVVATDVGSVHEVVDAGVGALVARRDPVALADAVAPLLLDADARRRAGEEGRRRVERAFSVTSGAAEFASLYRELSDARGLRA
ncbi:MAG: glycosyltransferase family 4 protein [Miltoncostaeaceae bacterium]